MLKIIHFKRNLAMKYKIVFVISFFLNVNAVYCQDNNKTVITNSTFFKINSVYTNEPKNDSISLYCFSSNDSAVYISKIKIKKYDALNKSKDVQLNTDLYAKFRVDDNLMKMQIYTFKTATIRRNIFQIIWLTLLPIPRQQHSYNVTISDHPLINEGRIMQDSIIITKKYIGTNKSNFKKGYLSKINEIKLKLTLNPNLTGILVREYENADYNVVITTKK